MPSLDVVKGEKRRLFEFWRVRSTERERQVDPVPPFRRQKSPTSLCTGGPRCPVIRTRGPHRRKLFTARQYPLSRVRKPRSTSPERGFRMSGARPMALHEQCVGATDEWYTPPHVFEALGCTFHDDVASPGSHFTPWVPARRFITERSLETDWMGFVWMNPPFGARNGLVPWLEKFCRHANGIALVPDRTSAPWWQTYATLADRILFVAPKLKFIGVHGEPGPSPAQGTCLLGIGNEACRGLERARAAGLGILMMPT